MLNREASLSQVEICPGKAKEVEGGVPSMPLPSWNWPALCVLSGVYFCVRDCVKIAAILFPSPRVFAPAVRATFTREIQIISQKFTPLSSIRREGGSSWCALRGLSR